MGKKNDAIVPFFKDKFRFSDLFNGAFFNGEQIIKPKDLELVPSDTGALLKDKSKKQLKINRFRDITMKWQQKVTLAILACEIQENVHYAMPVRNMIYDGLCYAEQIENSWNTLSNDEKKDVDSAEFLSHFRKDDSINPVITLVFYYGDNWDGNVDIHSMFKDYDSSLSHGIGKLLLEKYVPNYRINLINPTKLEDLSVFKSDLHLIFSMLKYKNDKDKLFRFTKDNSDYFESVSSQTAYAITTLLDSQKLLNEFLDKDEKEEKNMCKALEDLYNDGVAEGERKGRLEGRLEGRLGTVSVLKSIGWKNDAIIDKLIEVYNISTDEAKELVAGTI
ncbi:MAG: hypothetical protein E7259_07895 [Lachnospiraceae bacterium]|nr:hypothetical protein [Lachnospiraceae bacterium]